MRKSNLRIVFMGTPDFAVATLKVLVDNDFDVVGVITSPDRPAGRGQKITESAVKKYAKEKKLNILQPVKLKDPSFINNLKSLNADLQIIVAFRMLPEIVWNMPKLGTVNLHASLLPEYRGAAPINWAVINGEKTTGVTTFFLRHEIDTGDIILQKEVSILEKDSAGELHDRLMDIGAKLMLESVVRIEGKNIKSIEQNSIITRKEELKQAPKIFKNDCRIDWNKEISEVYNFIRGLSPYPAAWTEIAGLDEKRLNLKIFKTEKIIQQHNYPLGKIISNGKTFLHIAMKNGFLSITQLQLAGKKRLDIEEFLRGIKNIDTFQIV